MRDPTSTRLSRDLLLVTGVTDPADVTALEDALRTVAKRTEVADDALNEAMYRLACLGFSPEEICDLLYPITVFAEAVCESVPEMAHEAGRQIICYNLDIADAGPDLLVPIREVTEEQMTTAREVFDALAYCGPVMTIVHERPTSTIYRIGRLAREEQVTGALAGSYIRRSAAQDLTQNTGGEDPHGTKDDHGEHRNK